MDGWTESVDGPGTIVAAATPEARHARAAAAAVALAVAEAGSEHAGSALLVDLAGAGLYRPSMLATDAARGLAGTIATIDGWGAVPRGRLCIAVPEAVEPGDPVVPPELRLMDLLDVGLGSGAPAVVHCSPSGFRVALDTCRELDPRTAALIQARPPREEQTLLSALSFELRGGGFRHRIWRRPPGLIQGRRALAGLDPGGETSRRARATVRRLGAQEGQVVPAVAGLLLSLIHI